MNKEKTKAVIGYIYNKKENISLTRLYQLLFFVDVLSKILKDKPIINDVYKKMSFGPFYIGSIILETMQCEKNFFNSQVDWDLLENKDKLIIDQVLQNFSEESDSYMARKIVSIPIWYNIEDNETFCLDKFDISHLSYFTK